jgi:hypothetical protein
MSHYHQETVVHAIIPSRERPTRHVVARSGEYPRAVFCPEQDRTLESTFHRIGRELGFAALSVDRREPNINADDFVYRAKKVPEAILPPDFEWKTIEE